MLRFLSPSKGIRLPGDQPGSGGELSQAVMLGLNFAVGMAVCTFVGYSVDRWRGGGIFFTACGMAMGLAYGGYHVWRVVRVLKAQSEALRRSRAGTEAGSAAERSEDECAGSDRGRPHPGTDQRRPSP
jgi:F0F1-type ATP synthase assembly protein I